MSTPDLPADVRELLAAIRDALRLPLPATADDDRVHDELLYIRAWRVRITADAVAGGRDAAKAADQLRTWTAETPVTYTAATPLSSTPTQDIEGSDR
ncbi:hypothetical protein RKE29_02135 [Streptomyces sp. B1866]|uniref:hypothetical protein n=1 Tax=Streptomyces sp. B1866 TaxID=3075431 RepID=UPI00288EE777|nr:hypothetical protein [Streptomyces sp. B1866]MDT3395460.1 hypothetical protein [Streptomyces sp. B1866]